jgi:hypothetical protein
MATLTHSCPHCLTEHIALKIVSGTPIPDSDEWAAYLRCPKCASPCCAIMVYLSRGIAWHDFIKGDRDAFNLFEPTEFWPEPPKPNIPDYLPPDVIRVYLQAERNFPINGNEEAAGTMYGKALDIGLLKIDSSLKGMLGQKIRKLAEDGKLTPDIAEWSGEIRDIRNDATHEEAPITREELEALRSFTEMVLRYLFTLPNMVRKRRGEKLPWEEKASPSD